MESIQPSFFFVACAQVINPLEDIVRTVRSEFPEMQSGGCGDQWMEWDGMMLVPGFSVRDLFGGLLVTFSGVKFVTSIWAIKRSRLEEAGE